MNKTTQPIRDRRKINEIFHYMRGKNYRDFVMAKVQLNTARRISDIVKLKVSDVMDTSGRIKKHMDIVEKKTGKTARIVLNQAIYDTLKEFIETEHLTYNSYLFQSRKGDNKPITTTQAHRIFQDVGTALKIENFGSHSLRKTWGYFCYKETKNIALIMEVFNHSSEKITLRYIGITQKDMDVMYMNIRF